MLENIKDQLERFGFSVELSEETNALTASCQEKPASTAERTGEFVLHSLDDVGVQETSGYASKNRLCKILMNRNSVLGLLEAEKSTFDTEHFGFGIGKLKALRVADESQNIPVGFRIRDVLLRECSSWMKESDVKCLVSRVPYNDGLSLAAHERNDFIVADTLLTFQTGVTPTHKQTYAQNGHAFIRTSTPSDEDALMDIAKYAFKNDHFHRDSRFPTEKCDDLFSKWVYNCCNGLADSVFVAIQGNQPAGFITCKTENKENGRHGVIDLVAVAAPYQRNGLGKALVKESLRYFSKLGVRTVFVGTQANNIGATRTYEKLGFRFSKAELTFHKWLEE